MSKQPLIDTARLSLMLNELRLPTIKAVWARFTEQADREGWPAAKLLSALAEQERRIGELERLIGQLTVELAAAKKVSTWLDSR